MIWRIYLRLGRVSGRFVWQEFGIDYDTLDEAKRVASEYRKAWPNHNYRIRRYA